MKRLLFMLSLTSSAFSQELILEEIEVIEKKESFSLQELEESFAADPGEALSRMEGIWNLRKGSIASDIVLRGFGGREISIMDDGARIWGACPNRMDPPLFHVELEEIGKIEVVRGAFNVRNYGSLGGSVNVITAKPKKGLHGKIKTKLGSFSLFNPSVDLSHGGEGFYGLIGYSYRFSKPYITGEGKRFTEYSNYKPENINSPAYSINTLWTRVGLKTGNNSALSLSYTAQRIRNVLYPYLMMDSPEDNADRLSIRFRYGNLKLTTYYNQIYHLMNNTKRVAMSFMETEAKSKNYGLKAEYRKGNALVGLEAFGWNWDAVTKMGSMPAQSTIPGVETTNLGMYGEYRKSISGNISMLIGLRLDTTKTQADRDKANTALYYRYHGTIDTEKSETYPSGNIQLSYRPTETVKINAGIGYSVRVPDGQERYFALDRTGMMESIYGDWVGNPALKPPRNTEIDFGIELTSDRVSGEATLFYSSVKDHVILYNDTTVFGSPIGSDSDSKARSYTNVDAVLLGGEGRLTFALTETLFLEGGFSYVRGAKKTDPSRNITDNDLAEIPPLKGRVILRYDTGNYFAQIEGVFQATQDRVDSDLKEEKTPGWGVLNIRAGLTHDNFKVMAGADNLFNKFYYEHLSYLRDPFSRGSKVPQPGRSLFLSISYNF